MVGNRLVHGLLHRLESRIDPDHLGLLSLIDHANQFRGSLAEQQTGVACITIRQIVQRMRCNGLLDDSLRHAERSQLKDIAFQPRRNVKNVAVGSDRVNVGDPVEQVPRRHVEFQAFFPDVLVESLELRVALGRKRKYPLLVIIGIVHPLFSLIVVHRVAAQCIPSEPVSCPDVILGGSRAPS